MALAWEKTETAGTAVKIIMAAVRRLSSRFFIIFTPFFRNGDYIFAIGKLLSFNNPFYIVSKSKKTRNRTKILEWVKAAFLRLKYR